MGHLLSGDDVTYPPLDVPKPVADSVWIVDSGPLYMLGMPLPVRMTVIRLGNGDMLLHSPTRYDDGLRREIEHVGRIRHLVAPSVAHWVFVKDWQARCPEAVTWAVPGLRDRAQVRNSGLRIDHELDETPPADWAGELNQAVLRGGMGFAEVDFFHEPTRTLILTDLVVNLEPRKLPLALRPGAWLVGATAPNGKAPVYVRGIILLNRREALATASRLLGWEPERVVFSHGRWFERDGAARLRGSLSWLV